MSRIPPLTIITIISALLLLQLTTSSAPPPQSLFTNPDPGALKTSGFKIPTVHESAVLARRLLNLSSIATLATVFPSNDHDQGEYNGNDLEKQQLPSIFSSPPDSVAGSPIGLMEYFASCPPFPHHPTILAVTVATTFRNARAGSNVSMSLRWKPPNHPYPSPAPLSSSSVSSDSTSASSESEDPFRYSPVNMPRLSLQGYIAPIPASEVDKEGIDACFLARHTESWAWMPGNQIHQSWWAKFVVEAVYWIGGFGDRSFIGWIPVEEWEGITEEEIESARLVGEPGWKPGYKMDEGIKLMVEDEL